MRMTVGLSDKRQDTGNVRRRKGILLGLLSLSSREEFSLVLARCCCVLLGLEKGVPLPTLEVLEHYCTQTPFCLSAFVAQFNLVVIGSFVGSISPRLKTGWMRMDENG
jgi:hypothetical protein